MPTPEAVERFKGVRNIELLELRKKDGRSWNLGGRFLDQEDYLKKTMDFFFNECDIIGVVEKLEDVELWLVRELEGLEVDDERRAFAQKAAEEMRRLGDNEFAVIDVNYSVEFLGTKGYSYDTRSFQLAYVLLESDFLFNEDKTVAVHDYEYECAWEELSEDINNAVRDAEWFNYSDASCYVFDAEEGEDYSVHSDDLMKSFRLAYTGGEENFDNREELIARLVELRKFDND
ncbi:MAG: hypothetical protein ACK5M0_04505 [Bacteroidales bacterium]